MQQSQPRAFTLHPGPQGQANKTHNTQHIADNVRRDFAQDRPLQQRINAIVDSLQSVYRVRRLPFAGLVYFGNQDRQYVAKAFSQPRGFQGEVRVLQQFASNQLLNKYVPEFDATTLASQYSVIYPKLVPAFDLLDSFDPAQTQALLDWNRQLIQDVHSAGLRLCDHKIDNVLYSVSDKCFYLTDLEAVVKDTQSCEITTFRAPSIDWQDSRCFDYIHFLASFQYMFGLNALVEREFELLTQQLEQTLPLDYSHQYLFDVVRAIALMYVRINQQTLTRLRYPRRGLHTCADVISRGEQKYKLQPLCQLILKSNPQANADELHVLLKQVFEQIEQIVDKLAYFKTMPADDQYQLKHHQLYIAAGCISVLLKNPASRQVNISDLLEELKPPKQTPNESATKLAGKGSLQLFGKGYKSAVESIVIAVVLIALICYLCRDTSKCSSAEASCASTKIKFIKHD